MTFGTGAWGPGASRRKTLRSRITKAQGRRVALIDRHHTLESAGERRKLIGARNVLGDQFVPAGDLHLMASNRSAQPLAGRFAHLGRFGI